jgi:hypothetical protein
MESPNTASLAHWFTDQGSSREQVHNLFATFNANAAPFRKESEAHE